MLLEVTRLTHSLLSEHVALDPFDDLLAEVRGPVRDAAAMLCVRVR